MHPQTQTGFHGCALSDMPSTDMQNSLNALDTRDITLPRRLWSWLVAQAKKNDESVDEVIARLIDMYRHPEVSMPDLHDPDTPVESRSASAPPSSASPSLASSENERPDTSRPQGAPPPSANADSKKSGGGGPDTYSAADRLRKASDRLQHLMGEGGEKKTRPSARGADTGGTQIQELLKNNDKLQNLEPPEPTPQKDPDEGVSMFDMAAGADAESDQKDNDSLA